MSYQDRRDIEKTMTRRYAYFCPVCVEIMQAETCPKCSPEVLLLRVYRDSDDKKPAWRTLA